jgi:hypothetical protein
MRSFLLPPGAEQQRIDTQSSGALQIVPPKQPRVHFVPSQQLPDFFAPEQFFQTAKWVAKSSVTATMSH